MAVDFSSYLPPGIYSNPLQGPQLSVNSSLPRGIGLFGTALGYKTFVQSVLINPDTNSTTPSASRTLEQKGIDVTTLRAVDPNSGIAYVLNADYTVVPVSGVAGSSTTTYTFKRVITGAILPGDTVQISYQYSDADYYNAYTFYDYQDVVAAYGAPFRVNEDGTEEIQSELTLAAKFAFLNGAYQIVCSAVKPTGTIVNNRRTATLGDYEVALQKLENEELISVIVPCTGNSQPLFSAVRLHVENQSEDRHERRAILGVDGTKTAVSTTQRIANAQEITSRRIMLVSPSSFVYESPELNRPINLGGQFMAASLAGMTTRLSFAQPLTHKKISGWAKISESETMNNGQMTEESKNGLSVVEYNRQRQLRVRHGVTTDVSDLLAREWSIVGQEDAMVYRLRDYLDDASLIGQPIYNYTLVNVKASAEAALQSLVRDGLLVDYVGLSVRQLLTNPDVIEISFGWKPAFPLNYIVLTFSVSLTTGSTTTNTGTNGGSTGNLNNSTSVTQITSPTSSISNSFGGPSNTLQSF